MEWIPLAVRSLTILVGLMIGFTVPVRSGSLATGGMLVGVGLIIVVVIIVVAGPWGLDV